MLDAALARAGELTPAVKVADPVEVVPAEPSAIPAELVPLGSTVEEPAETKPVTLLDVMDAVEPASEERKETSEADTPEPKPEIAESPVVTDSRDPWDAGLERLRDLARDRADGGGNAAQDWTQRERLLTWMAEPNGQEGDGQGAWDVLVSALTEAAAHEGDATSLPDFQSAAQALEQAAPLEVRDLRFCKRVLGFGDYEPVDDDRFKAGQSVILYCELAGLRFEPVGDRVRSRLSSTVEVTPASGGEPVWTCSLGKADDLCRRRRRDYYVNYRIPLPETLAPGAYQLRLIQTDAIANRTTTGSLPFTISP